MNKYQEALEEIKGFHLELEWQMPIEFSLLEELIDRFGDIDISKGENIMLYNSDQINLGGVETYMIKYLDTTDLRYKDIKFQVIGYGTRQEEE